MSKKEARKARAGAASKRDDDDGAAAAELHRTRAKNGLFLFIYLFSHAGILSERDACIYIAYWNVLYVFVVVAVAFGVYLLLLSFTF